MELVLFNEEYYSSIPRRRTLKTFLQDYLVERPATKRKGIAFTKQQCRGGAKRSLSDLAAIWNGYHKKKVTPQEVLETLPKVDLGDNYVYVRYCPTVCKVVVAKKSKSLIYAYHNSNNDRWPVINNCVFLNPGDHNLDVRTDDGISYRHVIDTLRSLEE